MTKPLYITDHALVRMLDRLGRIDMEGSRAAFGKPLVAAFEAARKSGWEGELILRHGGYSFIIEEHRVITVLDPSQRPKARAAKRALVLDVVAS